MKNILRTAKFLPACGLAVTKPTQTLKSVKGPGNAIGVSPKWSRTLPSLIYCSWIFIEIPSSIEKNQISKLIFDTRFLPGL
jgi:hypothetical protein